MLLMGLSLCAFLLGAILHRIASGWMPTGSTFLARLVWAIPTGLLAYGLTLDPLTGLLTVLGAYLGRMIQHGPVYVMGRGNGSSAMEDGSTMAAIGHTRLALTLGPDALMFAFAGVLYALWYEIAWRLPVPKAWEGNPNKIVDHHTSYGELLWGGTHWLVLVLAYYFSGVSWL